MHEGTHSTGERDENYDLISTVYHALHGAETVDMYIQDAEEAGDKELADFFRTVKNEYRDLAAKGKQLIGRRIGGTV